MAMIASRLPVLSKVFCRPFSFNHRMLSGINTVNEHIFTQDHVDMTEALGKLIEREINPYVDQWETEKQFPAHTVLKKLGDGGFLGPTRPQEYGGLGLDYSFSIAIAEELGNIRCAGVPMAIGVHTGVLYIIIIIIYYSTMTSCN